MRRAIASSIREAKSLDVNRRGGLGYLPSAAVLSSASVEAGSVGIERLGDSRRPLDEPDNSSPRGGNFNATYNDDRVAARDRCECGMLLLFRSRATTSSSPDPNDQALRPLVKLGPDGLTSPNHSRATRDAWERIHHQTTASWPSCGGSFWNWIMVLGRQRHASKRDKIAAKQLRSAVAAASSHREQQVPSVAGSRRYETGQQAAGNFATSISEL